jgi:hypothetical protein
LVFFYFVKKEYIAKKKCQKKITVKKKPKYKIKIKPYQE